MCSKNARDIAVPRPWSLATRLTAYYAATAFVIVLLTMGALDWALVRNFRIEDDRLLADKLRLMQSLLEVWPHDATAINQEVNEAWQAGQQTQVFIRILVPPQRLVTESPGMNETLPPDSFPSATEASFPTGVIQQIDSGRSFRLVTGTARIPNESGEHWTIHVAIDRTQEQELIAQYRRQLLYVLLTALPLCAFAGHAIARRGLHPVQQIIAAAQQTQPGTLDQRLSTRGLPAELLQLAETFNDMLERLQQAFERLSRFSADIAHELRTPVNNLRGELDVALQQSRTPQDYEQTLASGLEECQHLSRLIDDLLFLARAEHPETNILREPIEVVEELRKIQEFFEPTAQEAHIDLRLNATAPLVCPLCRSMFQRAISNLIMNAITHNQPGGKITLHASSDRGCIRLDVHDTGRGIPADHLPRVFERFYRAETPVGDSKQGTGLGLAIVKGIVDLHGGSVDIRSSPEHGTTVSLWFPQTN